MTEKLKLTEQQWRDCLTEEQFNICRQKGTEAAFSGAYYHDKQSGIYHCVCCGAPLFNAESKYDSGSGWPSFWNAVDDEALEYARDTSGGVVRTEISCKNCDAHLGHVFEDGPQPSGLRFCVNSVSLHRVGGGDLPSSQPSPLKGEGAKS